MEEEEDQEESIDEDEDDTQLFCFNKKKSLNKFVVKTFEAFVSDLRQVGGFLRFPTPIKLTAMI